MTKQDIDEILSETDGKIIYIEQLLQILTELGYTYEESNVIRKNYAKRYADKVMIFENQLRHQIGEDLAKYVISKIRDDVRYLYWKCHEDVILESRLAQ